MYSITVSCTVIISAFLTSTYKPVSYVAFTNEDKYIILLLLIFFSVAVKVCAKSHTSFISNYRKKLAFTHLVV